MDLTGGIIRALINPIWLRRGHEYEALAASHQFEELEHFTSSQLKERQLLLLRRLLIHAQRNTRHYRRVFAEYDFDPEKLQDLSELKRLPMIDKTVINARGEELLSEPHRRASDCHESHTGGSTGQPMTFYRDHACLIFRRALDFYLERKLGYEIGDKLALLWGNATDIPQPATGRQELIERLVWRRISYMPVQIEAQRLLDFAAQVNRFGPAMMRAYPSLLHFYCRFLREHKVESVPIPLAVVTAEQLFGFQRELIAETLGGEVMEKYGAREIGTVAIECKAHCGLHLITDSVLVEIEPLPDKSLGGVGRIIVTDLRNYAMPLIRYDIGDLAELDSTLCSCGFPYPRLVNICGRANDIMYRRDMTPISGIELTDPIADSGINAQTQIVQNEPGQLLLRIVGLASVPREPIAEIRRRFEFILGEGGEIEIEDVDAIERDRSGKFRYTMSNVKAGVSSSRPASD